MVSVHWDSLCYAHLWTLDGVSAQRLNAIRCVPPGSPTITSLFLAHFISYEREPIASSGAVIYFKFCEQSTGIELIGVLLTLGKHSRLISAKFKIVNYIYSGHVHSSIQITTTQKPQITGVPAVIKFQLVLERLTVSL